MAKNENTETENSPKKGNKTVLLIIIGFVILGVTTFCAVYYYMSTHESVKVEKVETTTYQLMEDTQINLSDKNAKKYLKTSVALTYDKTNKDLGKEIEEKKLIIQDATVWYLKSKQSADFESENKDELKKGLVERLNKELDKGKVIDVLFTGEKSTNFVVQ
ncbi:flagellar basal body-associated FliL family protein [Clostridium sp. SHJSY1]|uniref:flagellar basal body-associated FliL family protein n=1 Tax=Clostridium sp. SHJSY1 TaxID=2942483 RepID=UPI00287621ED|nr:flagellar basal body-associated FliL family protein [Clostridium sp. SHJSY1]MDS0524099.1 flagellar basal body-associated FliL family protein [Clostridium sp. SHJSY1]